MTNIPAPEEEFADDLGARVSAYADDWATGFSEPEIPALREDRPSRCWYRPAAMAGSLVAAATAAVMLIRDEPSTPTTTPVTGPVPATLNVAGAGFEFVRTLPWATPATVPGSETHLTVLPQTYYPVFPDPPCNPDIVRPFVVTRTPDQLVIQLAVYRPIDPLSRNAGYVCGGPVAAPVPVTIELGEPPVGRTLIDGTTGSPHPLG